MHRHVELKVGPVQLEPMPSICCAFIEISQRVYVPGKLAACEMRYSNCVCGSYMNGFHSSSSDVSAILLLAALAWCPSGRGRD